MNENFFRNNWFYLLLLLISVFASFYSLIEMYEWPIGAQALTYSASTTAGFCFLLLLIKRMNIDSAFARMMFYITATNIYLWICFEFLAELVRNWEEHGETIIIFCITIPSIVLFAEFIFFFLVLLRKKLRTRYADRIWKIFLIVFYMLFICGFFVFAILLYLLYRSFHDIGPINFGGRY